MDAAAAAAAAAESHTFTPGVPSLEQVCDIEYELEVQLTQRELFEDVADVCAPLPVINRARGDGDDDEDEEDDGCSLMDIAAAAEEYTSNAAAAAAAGAKESPPPPPHLLQANLGSGLLAGVAFFVSPQNVLKARSSGIDVVLVHDFGKKRVPMSGHITVTANAAQSTQRWRLCIAGVVPSGTVVSFRGAREAHLLIGRHKYKLDAHAQAAISRYRSTKALSKKRTRAFGSASAAGDNGFITSFKQTLVFHSLVDRIPVSCELECLIDLDVDAESMELGVMRVKIGPAFWTSFS